MEVRETALRANATPLSPRQPTIAPTPQAPPAHPLPPALRLDLREGPRHEEVSEKTVQRRGGRGGGTLLIVIGRESATPDHLPPPFPFTPFQLRRHRALALARLPAPLAPLQPAAARPPDR